MALPHTFGPQSGNIALSQLDDNFTQLGLGVFYPCTATGTNTIALTPSSGWPTVSSYTNTLPVVFNAAATSTGAVTVNVSAVGALNLYLPDAATQAGSGSLTSGKTYVIIYVSTLNSGAGGFLIIYPSTTGLTVLRSYLAGLTLSNDGSSPNTVVDVAAGQCADSTNAVMINLGAFTKSTGGSWVAGSGSNGMGQGLTIAASTWYHVFAIINAAAADVYFDTSASAANAPASTTAFRRIGSFKTDGSVHIFAFVQDGEYFQWKVPVADASSPVTNPGTSAVTRALGSVPLGVTVKASLQVITQQSDSAGGVYSYHSDLATSDIAPTSSFSDTSEAINVAGGDAVTAGRIVVRVNTSAQIRSRVSFSNANTTLTLNVLGWYDTRGRDS